MLCPPPPNVQRSHTPLPNPVPPPHPARPFSCPTWIGILSHAAEEPIPLSTFSQAACDVLLPVLPKNQELSPHEFKSQVGGGVHGYCVYW